MSLSCFQNDSCELIKSPKNLIAKLNSIFSTFACMQGGQFLKAVKEAMLKGNSPTIKNVGFFQN